MHWEIGTLVYTFILCTYSNYSFLALATAALSSCCPVLSSYTICVNEIGEWFPNSFILCNIAGASNAGLKQFDAAVDNFKKVLKIDPNDAIAYNNMGSALQDMGNAEAAIDCYKNALKINHTS